MDTIDTPTDDPNIKLRFYPYHVKKGFDYAGMEKHIYDNPDFVHVITAVDISIDGNTMKEEEEGATYIKRINILLEDLDSKGVL